ncbi:hypothetical protein PMI05_01650 [Brevibacillus sp. BC25]|nr:hypothetical protein PMI05_01650 [Brevibacillus sp. BC25]
MSHQNGYFFEKHLFSFQTFVDIPDLKAKMILVMGLSVRIESIRFIKKKCFPALSRKADIDAWRSFIASSTVHSTLALRLML